MSAGVQTKVQASPAQNFTPVQTGLLQRKSALCNTPGLVEDSWRYKEKLTLQRSRAYHHAPAQLKHPHPHLIAPKHQLRRLPVETIKLDAEIDATD